MQELAFIFMILVAFCFLRLVCLPLAGEALLLGNKIYYNALLGINTDIEEEGCSYQVANFVHCNEHRTMAECSLTFLDSL